MLLEGFYLLAANLFLSTGIGPWAINRKPEKFVVEWSSAWSFVPGLVSVRDLEIGGTSRRAEWRTFVESGRLWMWLPSLVGRHVNIRWAHAVGGEVEVEILPPSSEPRPLKKKHRWQVTLDNLDVPSLESIRVNRFEIGRGRTQGSAHFMVRGPMHIDLETLDFKDTKITADGTEIASGVEIAGSLEVDEYVVGEDQVEDFIAASSGHLRIEADSDRFTLLNTYLRAVPWLRVGGSGHLSADIEAVRGELLPGSRVGFQGEELVAAIFGFEATGSGAIEGVVSDSAEGSQIEVDLDHLVVRERTREQVLLDSDELTIRVAAASARLYQPVEDLKFELDMEAAQIPDLAAFGSFVPPSTGIRLTGGKARLATRLSYDVEAESGDGWLRIVADEVAAGFGSVSLFGRVDLDARFPVARLEKGQVELGGSRLELSDVRVVEAGAVRREGWWARAKLPNGAWSGGLPFGDNRPRVAGRIEAEMRDSLPIVALVGERLPKIEWIDGLLTFPNVQVEVDAEAQQRRLILRGLNLTGGEETPIELLVELDVEGERTQGVVFARRGRLTAAVALEDEGRDWKFTGSRQWYDERAASYRGQAPAID